MTIWRISWEELGGEEHSELIASTSMNTQRATRFALADMRKSYKCDKSDIVFLNYCAITEVPSINKKYYYKIKLERCK